MDRSTTQDTPASAGARETVSERAAERAHEGIDQAARVASDAERRAREGASRAARSAEARARGTMETLSDRIQHNPLAAAGIAFAVGFFASSVLRR